MKTNYGVGVHADCSTILRRSCGRCLDNFKSPLKFSFNERFLKEKTESLENELSNMADAFTIEADGTIDVSQALEQYLVVLNMDKSHFNALSNIIKIYIRKRKYHKAEKLLKDYCNLFPNHYKPYYELGVLYEEIGEFDKAKEQHDIVSLIEPNYNDLTLAKIETKFGNFDLAINKLNKLLGNPSKTESQKYNIHQALSKIYHTIGKQKEAIKSSEDAYKLEST